MKKYLITLAIVVPLLIGCKALNNLTKFDLPFSKSFTLPALPVAGTPPALEIKGIETHIDSVLKSYNLSADKIQSVTLTKMEFTLSSPADGDLSFLKSVEIFITAEGLDQVKIAGITNVPDGTKVLSLTAEDVDLKNFILKDKFGLKIVTTTDKKTDVEQKIDMDLNFLADLKILGI